MNISQDFNKQWSKIIEKQTVENRIEPRSFDVVLGGQIKESMTITIIGRQLADRLADMGGPTTRTKVVQDILREYFYKS